MADLAPDHSTVRSMSFQRAVICVLLPFASGYYLSYLIRTIGALISGRMVAELHLTPADLGMLTSSYFFTFAVGQLPLGVALDRYGPRRVQLVLLPMAAVGAALFATGHDITLLTFARGLMGLGCAAALMAGLKAIRQWVPPERLALANGILIMLGALGALTSTTPAEALLTVLDWRELFGLLALATAGSALLIAAFAPRAARETPPAIAEQPKPALLNIYLDARFWRIAPMSAGLIGTSFAMQGLWAAPWLTDVARLDRQDVVDALFMMALALCAGALGLGVIADWLRRRGVMARHMLAGMAALSIAAQMALVLRLPVPTLLPWLILAVGASATVLSYAALPEIFPKEVAGRANSALNILHIGGACAIQSGIGVIVGLWAADSAGHSPVAAYVAAFGINLVPQCLALAWFIIAPVWQKPRAGRRAAVAQA